MCWFYLAINNPKNNNIVHVSTHVRYMPLDLQCIRRIEEILITGFVSLVMNATQKAVLLGRFFHIKFYKCYMKYWGIWCLILLFETFDPDMAFKSMVFVYDIEFESCKTKTFSFHLHVCQKLIWLVWSCLYD